MPHSQSRFAALLLPAALLIGGAAPARPTPDASPFLGTWELDLSRMPDSYGPPPKRVTFTFRDVGAGQWRTEIDITAPDDSVRHSAVQYRRDGRMVPGEGDTGEADSAAFLSPAPNVLVMGLAKNRTLGAVRTYVISADGREMTESAANVDETGAPFVRSFHFRRIR
ncbi:hypothetical protein P6144_15855 [Sphingomonas sp. HITSZ_GF]|uniref:hypothetical protein n=1 Tax=Sphingomonas sp. HITSZ_GF TaxID=3037247 RepID=UPI00240DA86D|nr:hypothetical protein [Sphingomonas sp. HITSZ_GF]MDG2535135.1 hypothetical protein [Sphingomonas sp. HITSZ_GF]